MSHNDMWSESLVGLLFFLKEYPLVVFFCLRIFHNLALLSGAGTFHL